MPSTWPSARRRCRAPSLRLARAAALADAYLRQQVEELRAERRATGGPPPDLKPAANGVGDAPIALMGAAPVVITGIAQNGGGRGRGGGRSDNGGGGGFVQRSYVQRSRNARADDILEAVMQRSRRR